MVAFILVPGNIFAHAVIDQSAAKVNENTFIFQVTYRLNYLNYDTFAPILATHVREVATSSPYLQYSFVNTDGEKVNGVNSTAIVLSEAEIVGEQYYFADKDGSFFTLLSIVQLSPELTASGDSLALQVDWLPFTLRKGGENQKVILFGPDLKNYKTPALDIK